MPKIRGIKPDYWTDEDIVELSIPARLLFIGLWNYACDNGHLPDKPKQIKMRIFPGDDINVAELLRELEAAGRINRDNGWATIPKFAHHQKPNKRFWLTCEMPGCIKPDGDSQPETPSGQGEPSLPKVAKPLPPYDGDGDGEVDGDGDGGSLVTFPSQSSKQRASINDGGLTRIREAIGRGCTKQHARKTADFILAKAPTDVRNPVNYVLKAIRDEPELYAFHRGNPTKDTCCTEPGHQGEWADACRACALDRKLGSA